MMSRVSLNLSSLSIQQPKLPSTLPPISHKFLDENPTLTTSYYHESDIFEDIPITLLLPGGITFKLIVKTGETVQEIKRKLDTEHGVPYSDATLYYNGKCMIDPLSLNDFPGLVRKTNVCLDVKISSAWKPKENVHYTSSQSGTQMLSSTTNKSDFMDIRVEPEVPNTTSTSSLNNISFVEYVDAPISNNNNTNSLVSNFSSVHQPDFFSDLPTSPPPLPNAFSDSPNAGKMNRRKPENETKISTTTIDIRDDDDPQGKEIQKLGGNTKRWKLCFLF